MRETYFLDRQEAGQRLAEELLRFKDSRPVILALPRGGVPIGLEAAKALNAPLDLVLVRKIGAPGFPELAVGAVADGPAAETILNEDIVRELNVSEAYLERETKKQLEEVERRRKAYLADRPRAEVKGSTAIIVDDGIATGATIRAAMRAVRKAGPARLVLAVPVAPPDTIERLRADADEVVCLLMPPYLGAISAFYLDFPQVSDDEVVEMMRSSLDLQHGRTATVAETAPMEPPTSASHGGTQATKIDPDIDTEMASHIRGLNIRHAELERQIDQELARPRPGGVTLQTLRRQKMRLEEEILRLTQR